MPCICQCCSQVLKFGNILKRLLLILVPCHFSISVSLCVCVYIFVYSIAQFLATIAMIC
jgi:hypothetical protein